jgi:hypothetical protein
MRLVLEIIRGKARGRRLVLEPGRVARLGRAKENDLVIADGLASRTHCQVQCGERLSRIRDLGSANGTMVNGAKVSDAELRDGDEIVVGETRLAVRIEKDAGPAAPPHPAGFPSDAVNGQERFTPLRSVAGQTPEALPLGLGTERRSRSAPSVRRPYAEGLADPDPEVRRCVLLAAAWAGELWVLEHCHKAARRPTVENWDAVMLLAVLGNDSHLQTILALEKFAELGPRRLRALGAHGHPQVLPLLLDAMERPDPVEAATAGRAFARITGVEIDSHVVRALTPDGEHAGEEHEAAEPTGGEEEDLPEEVLVPDPRIARAHWEQTKSKYAKGTRWCRGLDLSESTSDVALAELDLESRWEACLRGRFYSTWRGSLVDLERFPQTAPTASQGSRQRKE